ncbi:RsbR, positive regulator of sigma-B [Labilithrix luteola]|uniref:RsbR, positive regulator of sigma-B n=1 Tax=Labilithrix luteola TaxID=1391654 RepID=A0A0K1PN44_9BACT|nr:STAS domain-containing protein [Labilithrix luteola]AKU94534.1 RsbR, positive regulator of sigma-B [Labilithrix luteola]
MSSEKSLAPAPMPTSAATAGERYRIAFEQAPVGVFTFDRELHLRECNDAFCEILATKRERIVGFDLHKIKDQRVVPTLVKAVAGELSTYVGDYDSTTSDAHVVVNMRCRPFIEADGTISGGLGIVEDVTERTRVEKELRDQLHLVKRQAETIRALGVPILRVWESVLCLPVIGVVDTARAAELTEALLSAIVTDKARFAVIDLTGVEIVDTSTANHLIQLASAASMLGTRTVLCGIRPTVAQIVVSLAIDLQHIKTVRTTYEALQYCIKSLASR